MASKRINIKGVGVVNFPSTMSDDDIKKAINEKILPKHGITPPKTSGKPDDVRYAVDPATGRGGISLPGVTTTADPSPGSIDVNDPKIQKELAGLPQQKSQYIPPKPGTTFGEYAGMPAPIGVNSKEFGDLARRATPDIEHPISGTGMGAVLEKTPAGGVVNTIKEELPNLREDLRSIANLSQPGQGGMADIAGAARLAGAGVKAAIGMLMQASPEGAGFTLSDRLMGEFSPGLQRAVSSSISPVRTLLENTKAGQSVAKNIPPELIDLGDLIFQGALFHGVQTELASQIGVKIAGGENLTTDDIKTLRDIGDTMQKGVRTAIGEKIVNAINQTLDLNHAPRLTENATGAYRFEQTREGASILRPNTLSARESVEGLASQRRVAEGQKQVAETTPPSARFASDFPDADVVDRPTKPYENPPIIIGGQTEQVPGILHPDLSVTEPKEVLTATGEPISEYEQNRQRLGVLFGTREGKDIFTPIVDYKPIDVITGETKEPPLQTNDKVRYEGSMRDREGRPVRHSYRITDPNSPAFNGNVSIKPGESLADAIAAHEETFKTGEQMTAEKLLKDLGVETEAPVDKAEAERIAQFEERLKHARETSARIVKESGLPFGNTTAAYNAGAAAELPDAIAMWESYKKNAENFPASLNQLRKEFLDGFVAKTRGVEPNSLTPEDIESTMERMTQQVLSKGPTNPKANDIGEFNPKDSKGIRKTLTELGISGDIAKNAARLMKHAETPEQVRSVLEQTAALHYRSTRPDEFRRMLESNGAKDSPHGWAALEVLRMQADEMQAKLGIRDDPNRIAQRTLDDKAREMFGKTFDNLSAREIMKLRGTNGDAANALTMQIVPGLHQFIQQDIIPAATALGTGLKETTDAIVKAVAPRYKANRDVVDAVMRAKGDREKANFHVESATYNIEKVFNSMSLGQQVDFIDRFKTGQQQGSTQMQMVRNMLHGMDDDLFRGVVEAQINGEIGGITEKDAQKWNTMSGAEQDSFIDRIKSGTAHPEKWMNRVDENTLDYLDNHLRVLWKTIPGVAGKEMTPWIGASRSPFAGSQGFRRQHSLPDMSTGIAMGGEPYSYNPIVLFKRSYADAMKYITALRMWKSFKDLGLRKFVPKGGDVPDGFERLNDRLARVYFKTDAGMVEPGEWYVEKSAARLLNNHLSRDYVRESAFGRGLMAIKNATTQVELGLSPFHLMFETIEAASSSMALGVRELTVPGHRVQGIKDIAGAAFAPEEIARLGGTIRKYAANPTEFKAANPGAYDSLLKRFPDIDNAIDALFLGGGKLTMHEDWKVNSIQTFQNALKSGNYIGAALRALPAGSEKAMSYLFEKYIPSLKVGIFAKEFTFEMAERQADLLSGKITKSELAHQVWDFVEHRFGEMNFDNLFWNRTLKSIAQLNFRSVTWKLGNVEAFGGAVAHTPWQLGELANAAKEGRAPRLDRNIAWTMSMGLTTGVLASIASRWYTGKYPWELAKDKTELLYNMVYPRIDPNDEKQRLSMPTYFRDVVSLGRSVPQYIQHSLSGEIGRVADIWQNRDFYGTEVYDPDDPKWKQARDIAAHMVPSPFSIQSFRASKDVGMSNDRAVMGFFGFTKAPHYISDTKAETEMQDILRRRGEFTHTKQEAEERTFKAQFARRMREGTVTDEDFQRAVENHLFQDNGELVPDVMERIQLSPGQRMFKNLRLHEAKRVYDMMDEDERNNYTGLLMEKVENAINQNNTRELQLFQDPDARDEDADNPFYQQQRAKEVIQQ